MATAPATVNDPPIRSLIPARIDRLPWSKFHTRLVTALGIAWVLDGLEITIAANVGSDLTLKNTLNMSAGAVSDIAWWYLIGEIIGALFFGQLSDKLGRRNLFMITLAVYLVGSGLTAVTPRGGYWFIFLYATRVLAGPVLALVIIYVRRNLPESPRWQIMHGKQAEAEASVREIEEHVEATKGAQFFGAIGSHWYGHLIGDGSDRNTLFAVT